MKMRQMLLAAAVLSASAAFSDTMVFAPGDGVTTNVAERLAAGVDVQANVGASGGGIVNLVNPMNGKIGTAAVKCGTLGVGTLHRARQRGGIGTLSLGNGTFRYSGSDPASTDMNILLDAASLDDACVLWCDGDLRTTGTFDANNGALVKAGPGTLTIATASRTGKQVFSNSRQGTHYDWIMNMKANGDSPTLGYGNLTVREGHLVIDTPASVVTVLGRDPDAYDDSSYTLVGCRSGATAPGSEPYGHLDIRSGTVHQRGNILVGYRNGTEATRPDADSGSSFNIYGGNFTRMGNVANSINVGFVSAYNDRPGLPSFNIYGGTVDYIQYIRLAINRGSRGKLLVAGSTLTGYGIYGAHDNGGTSATDEYMPQAEVHVCSNGVLATLMILPCRSGFCDFTIKVTDGGTLRRSREIAPNSGYESAPMKLFLDGGVLELEGTGYNVVSSGFKTRLGPQQSEIKVTGTGTYAFPGSVATDDAQDGGLRIGGTTGSAFAFNGGVAIAGPVSVDGNVAVKIGADAATGTVVAEADDLSIAFGWKGSRFATLTASGWDVPGFARVAFEGAWTAGTYDLVSLPADAAVDASRFILKTASDTTGVTFATRTENDRVILSATLAARAVGSQEWTNSAGGDWADGGNWGDGSGAAPSGADARAVFAAASAGAGTPVTLANGVTIGGLAFSASPGYSISGATLTLDNAGSAATVAATAGANEIAAPVAMAGETFIDAASGASLSVSGAVSGYGPLTVNAAGGTGTVTLSGASVFATAPYVKSGTLRVTNIADGGTASAVGAGTSVKVGTATFEYDGASGATDRTFEMAAAAANGKSALAATAGSTLTVNGPVAVADGTVFAKAGAGTVVLNGAGGYSFPCGAAVDEGTLAIGVPVLVQQSYAMTVAGGAALALNGGAALRSRILTGAGTVLWNGGTWYPVSIANSTAAFSAGAVRIGAGGARIDLSIMADQVLDLGGSWTAADGVAADGGITVSSSRPATNTKLTTVSFPANATYGFSGPVTLASGGVAKVTGSALASKNVAVHANGAIAAALSGSAAEEVTVNSLDLAAGSSVFAYASGANVCATLRATASMTVGGTVYVALCTGTGIPALSKVAGTYAILRGPKGTLDASKFAMSPRYASANGSFALDATAADYDQITLTLTSATEYNSQTQCDFRRDFVWKAGSGSWLDAANWECGVVPEDSNNSRIRAFFPSTVADGTVVTLGGNRIMEVLETAVRGDLWLVDGTVNPSGAGEYAFVKTTAGTLHMANMLGDRYRETYMDTSIGATQIVEGVLSSTFKATQVNQWSKSDGGTLRLEGRSESAFNTFGGTLAGHPGSFGADYPVNIQNGTLALLSSGEMPSSVAGAQNAGMNLRVEAGSDVVFMKDVSGTGPFVKTGAGTAQLGGTGAVTIGTAARGNGDGDYLTVATEIPANGTLPTTGLGVCSIAAGKLVLGLDDRQKVTIGGRLDIGQYIADFDASGKVLDSELEILGGTVTVNGDLNIGRGAGAYRVRRDSGTKKRNLTLTMHDGNLTFNGIYMCHDAKTYYNGTATINLHGGTITSKGGYVNLAFHRMSSHTEYGRAKSVINIYGGMFTNTATTLSLNAGGNAPIDINLYGGDFAWTAPFQFDGGNAADVANINLHGGAFTAPYITRNWGAAPIKFYFNGGAIRPTQDGASFRMNASYDWTSVIVATNGAAFDIPGAKTFTLNRPFAHESALGAAEDGGIIKRGTGTLLMSAANSCTGPCVVEEGVMRPTVAGAVPGGIVLAGGTFDCNGIDFAVPYLKGAGGEAVNGCIEVRGAMAPLASAATDSPYVTVEHLVLGANATVACPIAQTEDGWTAPYFRVSGSCSGRVVLDLGFGDDVKLPLGLRVKVAELAPGVASFLPMTVINYGMSRNRSFGKETVTDPVTGVTSIYAVLYPSGTLLKIR